MASAISIRATDSRIVENVLGVWPFEFSLPGSEKDPDEELPDPADPCIEPEDLYGNLVAVIAHVHMVWLTAIVAPPEQPYRALGGLHLRGSCARIDVVGNRIDGGVSHGIVLGGTYPAEVKAQPAPDKGHLPVGATIKLPTNQIPGLVEDEAGAPVIGLLLSLRTSAGVQVQSRLSGPPDGRFVFDSPGGTFRLVVTPGYQVVSAKLVANETLQVVVRRVDRRAETFDQARGQRARRSDADLLAQHRARSGLEAVEGGQPAGLAAVTVCEPYVAAVDEGDQFGRDVGHAQQAGLFRGGGAGGRGDRAVQQCERQ